MTTLIDDIRSAGFRNTKLIMAATTMPEGGIPGGGAQSSWRFRVYDVNQIASTALFAGRGIPAAKAAHGGEAVLAVAAIIIWHFYHVHLKFFNKSMFNGKLTYEEMEEEHPAELAQIESGKTWQKPAEPMLKKRQRFYFPVAALLLGFFGSGLVWFVTLENTAPITTVPARKVEVFAAHAHAAPPAVPTPRRGCRVTEDS
jgi:hypothetical protein